MVVIIGALLISSIKYVIRPMQLFEGPVKFFLNIAPNLFGSFLIPFAVYWFLNGKNFWMARIVKANTAYDLRFVCLTGFIMLVINEYLQQIPFFGRTFDYYDIWYSAIGLLSSYMVFSRSRHAYHEVTGD